LIYDKSIKQGDWNPLICDPLFRINNKVLGIIGFGHIGKRVIEKICSFGLAILIYDPLSDSNLISKYGGKK